MKVSALKKFSIKFGIICGMIVTLLSVFNAVLNTIQKWNETFETEAKIVMVESEPSSLGEDGFYLEQKMVGNPNGRVSKTVTFESFEFYEYNEDTPNEIPYRFDSEELYIEEEAELPVAETPNEGYMDVQERGWFTYWFISIFIGLVLWYGSYKLSKSTTFKD